MNDISDTTKVPNEQLNFLDSNNEEEMLNWAGLNFNLGSMSVDNALNVQYLHQGGEDMPCALGEDGNPLYWWGRRNNLNGMSVEDALKVQFLHQNVSVEPGVFGEDGDPLYWWGRKYNLDGMSVEDALKVQYYHGGSEPSKKVNTLNFVMQKDSSGNYSLYILSTYEPTATVIISFSFDGTSQTVTFPEGVKSYNTGIKSSVDATKPYAEIKNVEIASEDASYNYVAKISVKNGVFALVIDNDGDVTVDYIKYGTNVELPSSPAREGYTFTWEDSEGTIITGTTITMPESDYTIFGIYTKNSYELSFSITEEYLDNGIITTRTYSAGTISVDYGELVLNYLAAYAPVREGYTLSSWKTTGGTDITAAFTMPSSNFTANTNYSLNAYSLKYLVDNEIYEEESYYFGQQIVAVESPLKEGYTFSDWDIAIPTLMPSNNLIANAIFTANDYHIYYSIEGETAYVETHKFGDNISIRANEERTGYAFAWSPSSLPSTMPAEDINVEGTFTAIDYVFRCVVDGTVTVNETYHFGDSISAVTEPSKTGYTFVDWNPIIPSTMPAADLTCVAIFSANTYSITYLVDGEAAHTENHAYGSAISILPNESREGYTFSGWEPSSLPATMPAENIVVNGTFTINQYEIEYFVNGFLYSAETYNFGESIVPIDAPTREGYTFTGWEGIPQTMPAHNVAIYAEFTINSYTIAYFVDGTPYSAETYEYGAVVTPITTPTKVGHTFNGWDKEIPAVMPAEDVMINGSFTVNSHTINYLVDGETYSSETYEYGQTIVPIEAPTKVGYTFAIWSGMPAIMPDNDLNVSAIYIINHHTANYEIKNGGAYEPFTSVTYAYGETIVDPTVPERSGYTFAWDEHVVTMPDNDITIKGEYTAVIAATSVYYDTLPNGNISGLTPEVILAFTNNFDGEGVSDKQVAYIIPASQEAINYRQLAEEAYEKGDDPLGDYYYSLYEKYIQGNYPYTFVFAIPNTISFNKLTDAGGIAQEVTMLKTVQINGTQYTVYLFTTDTMFQVDTTLNGMLHIIFN